MPVDASDPRFQGRFAISNFYLCANETQHSNYVKDKFKFDLGRWARREMRDNALWVVPSSVEWQHWEPAINAMLAHLQSRCGLPEWQVYLENKVMMEMSIKIDQSEGTDAHSMYKMELHVRIGELDNEDEERTITKTFQPRGQPNPVTYDEFWVKIKRGKSVGDLFMTRYCTHLRADSFPLGDLDAVHKEPESSELTCKKRLGTESPADTWKQVFDIKTWGKKILQQNLRQAKRNNNRPTTFGSTAFQHSTVPSNYEVKDCMVQVDASNCLYLHPEKEDPNTGEVATWTVVANFCIQGCSMLLKWKDGDKHRSGVEMIIAERLVKVIPIMFE
jgi:hypothetical protein